MKNPALLWALQFQFNCEIYPIVQLSSLKLPIESQYIQVSSLKSISFPNVRKDSIFTPPGKVPLWKNCQYDLLNGKWKYEYGCVPLHTEISILLQKYLFHNGCLDSCLTIVVKMWKMIYLPKQVCLIVIHRNISHILDWSCCHKHQQQKKS